MTAARRQALRCVASFGAGPSWVVEGVDDARQRRCLLVAFRCIEAVG